MPLPRPPSRSERRQVSTNDGLPRARPLNENDQVDDVGEGVHELAFFSRRYALKNSRNRLGKTAVIDRTGDRPA